MTWSTLLKSSKLRNKILMGAALVSALSALAYTSVISLVLRQQYLAQYKGVLSHASQMVDQNLAERRTNLLQAAREMAHQQDLGTAVWYLTQYGRTEPDRLTLNETRQHLVREMSQLGQAAHVSQVALYSDDGILLAYVSFNSNGISAGYVEPGQPMRIWETEAVRPDVLDWGRAHEKRAGSERLIPKHRPMTYQEKIGYAARGTYLTLQAEVPVMGQVFNVKTGMSEVSPLGMMILNSPLDQEFVDQFSVATQTHINVFLSGKMAVGDLPEYDRLQVNMGRGQSMAPIQINGTAYFQSLRVLREANQVVGVIAFLESTQVVEKNIWEMIRTFWLITGGTLILVLPLAWYFAYSLAQPITHLISVFRKVASGYRGIMPSDELSSLVRDQARQDELGELTRSFIAMNDAITHKIHEINEMNLLLEQKVEQRTEALSVREQESRTLIENSPDTIARFDAQERCIYANPALINLVKGGEEALLGRHAVDLFKGENRGEYARKIRDVLETGMNAQFELYWTDQTGKALCSHIRLTPEFDLSGQVATVLSVGRDITERLEFESRIWQQANFDTLTKLPNRQMFYQRLAQAAHQAERSGKPLALMLVDLDHFKEVNDTLGHDSGDLLLVETAQRLISCLRESDMVARIGGDEFTVVIPDLSELAHVERIAEAILQKLSLPFKLAEEMAYVSASVGIAFYPDDATDLDVLFKNADQAMYVSKKLGRNRYAYFTQELQEAAQMRLRLTHELREGLKENQFSVYYQPIINLESGCIDKAEALLRWQHPQRGRVDPSEFIALAEETGLIVSVGDWVFHQVAQQCLGWRLHLDPRFQITVNKSPVQIEQRQSSSWPDYLVSLGLDSSAIAIEITERLLLNNNPDVLDHLYHCRQAGMQLAIDDFGVGYSSLSYLKKFDIDYLKIDRSYIQHIDTDSNDAVLSETIILMAHKLGLKVVAEGVETLAQEKILKEYGCDYVQGYLYAEPMPAVEFEVFYQRWCRGKTGEEG